VPAFWIDRHEVTNRQFAIFVAATGYRTQAEREGGSAIFVLPRSSSIEDPSQWWHYAKGASWRHPEGPSSDLTGKANYPVVQVTYEDALAYANWAGRELPNAIEWERAARGGQTTSRSPLSWAFAKGHPIANSWQGPFPVVDVGEDGYKGIAPVGCFPANDFGLRDMIGNVWEWTTSHAPGAIAGSRLLKGGSYLCAMNYCANFRAAAFQAEEHDLGAAHIGFRTISRNISRKSVEIG
jgi:formylglycine-generating enzyme required for sulfatase activity